MSSPSRILLGVTIAESLKFLGPLPSLLGDAGWDVHIVSNPGKEARFINQKNVTFHGIPMARKPSLASDFRSLFLWFQLLQKLKPSIVSIGTPKASLLGLFAAWVLRLPRRVYVLRGLRLETTTGPSRWLLSLLERVTAGCATHVLAVSHSLAAKYAKLGLCAARKITVLGSGSSHGVDIERFSPKSPEQVLTLRAQRGLAAGIPILGFVGRFSENKGAQVLLETRKKLLEYGIDHEILVVGPIEDSPETLDQLNGQGRRVKYVGEIRNVEDFYPLMTMLLLPTRREGFPNVVLEAGASGIPTVTMSVTGTVDAVIHDETGVLVEVGADPTFAEAVATLVRDSGRLAEFGKAARARIRLEFDEREVCQSLVAYYRSL